MLEFERFTLKNGLRVILHTDETTPFVVVNVTYNVGAKDEQVNRTGFAHLFEHLMFGGSKHAPIFDKPLELAGATNNAFTNNDVTNYYEIIPRENLETALWLESDRMSFLTINEKSLAIQKKVVVEEFKERYLNKPYGETWHLLRKMAYKTHPYQWPTIGKTIEHITEASIDDVQAFYDRFYHPNNAILTLCGNIHEKDKALIEKWFANLPSGPKNERNLPKEQSQHEARRMEHFSNVPIDNITMAFHMPAKGKKGYYECDLLSDLLSNGKSARLYQQLVKQQGLFSDINAYILGSFDPGLFIISGKPSHSVDIKYAEDAIWKQLNELISQPPSERELQKVQNKVEANLTYQLMEPLYQAINLAFFELLGDAGDVNKEKHHYQSVTLHSLLDWAEHLFQPEKSNTLWMLANQN